MSTALPLQREADDVLAIERAFPALRGRLPRVRLTQLPTRVHRLARLGASLGTDDLWVKRDDESGTLYGGNKPRKLEFLLGEALFLLLLAPKSFAGRG